MHRLFREVRFSINPFIEGADLGANPFASRPAGSGLALFLALGVHLHHSVDSDTGFVMNVCEIDKVVRREAVPLWNQYIQEAYRRGRHVDWLALADLLTKTEQMLCRGLAPCTLDKLSLRLNPFRIIAMISDAPGLLYFSETFEFVAMHKLWNPRWTDEQNFEVFGKCANPSGHGHNYRIEVTVTVHEPGPFSSSHFEAVVDQEVIQRLDHKNLNQDVVHFRSAIPTIENLAQYTWDLLKGRFEHADLLCVTVWESDRTSCAYYGTERSLSPDSEKGL